MFDSCLLILGFEKWRLSYQDLFPWLPLSCCFHRMPENMLETTFANPKSPTWAVMFSSNSMLLGFKSPRMIMESVPWCKYSTADAMSMAILSILVMLRYLLHTESSYVVLSSRCNCNEPFPKLKRQKKKKKPRKSSKHQEM